MSRNEFCEDVLEDRTDLVGRNCVLLGVEVGDGDTHRADKFFTEVAMDVNIQHHVGVALLNDALLHGELDGGVPRRVHTEQTHM